MTTTTNALSAQARGPLTALRNSTTRDELFAGLCILACANGLWGRVMLALREGGWFESGHEQAVREATDVENHDERVRAIRTMLAEETRLGMLVGVAVGFELARELDRPPTTPTPDPRQED